MAGDWIPMRTDLDEDPAVIGIASRLEVSELQVIGWLWKLWSVVSRQTPDGSLPHYSAAIIDRIVGRAGFASALESNGWLQSRTDSCRIPNFERWLGASSKKRQADALRKRDMRSDTYGPVSEKNGHEADTKRTSVMSSNVLIEPSGPPGGLGVQGEGGKNEIPRALSPSDLALAWNYHCPRKATRANGKLEEAEAEFAELIRLGHHAETIKAEIEQPERKRYEQLWQFTARFERNHGKYNGETNAYQNARSKQTSYRTNDHRPISPGDNQSSAG